MTDISTTTRLKWLPTPEDWIRFADAYNCHDFKAAMQAVAAWNLQREVRNIEGFERDTSQFEKRLARIKRKLAWIEARQDAHLWISETARLEETENRLSWLIANDRRQQGELDAAEQRVAEAAKALAEKRPVAGFEGRDEEWTLERRRADLTYEQAILDRIRETKRRLPEQAKLAARDFKATLNKHKLAGDLRTWARKGRDWQLEISDLAQLLHERTIEMQALEYRQNIADAARALVDAVNAPLDPHARLLALSDIRRHGSIDPDALRSSISEVAILAFAARKASDEFVEEVGEAFVGGSSWGQFVLNMRAFAKRNGLLRQPGGSTPAADGSYAGFAEFLWVLQRSMPEHLQYKNKKSTFVRNVKDAVRRGRKFAEETKRLEAAEDESTTA